MLKPEILSDYIFDILHQRLNRELHASGRDFFGKALVFLSLHEDRDNPGNPKEKFKTDLSH